MSRGQSRLSEEPPFSTTVLDVYCTYTSTATCFGLYRPSSGGTQIYKEVTTLTTDPLYTVQIVLYIFLANTAVVYLNVIARYVIVNAITSFLILKC
jgi:hypothetical protein